MKDRCPVTFVSAMAVSGFANGVANFVFTTAAFEPTVDDGKPSVDMSQHVAANLRMDLFCLQQLHDAAGKILADQVKPAGETTQ